MNAQVHSKQPKTVSVKWASGTLRGIGLPCSKRKIHALIEEGEFKTSQLRQRGWYRIDLASFLAYLDRMKKITA
jgi:hypothetical protein